MTERFIHTNYLARQKVQGGKSREQILPLGVVAIALGVVLLPDLSRRLAAGDLDGGRDSVGVYRSDELVAYERDDADRRDDSYRDYQWSG